MTARADLSPLRRRGAMSPERMRAARQAITLCATADRLAQDAVAAVGIDDEQLFSLLEQREGMLADLTEHLVVLRLERPSADSAVVAVGERMADDADALVAEVCNALSAANRSTMALTMRVAERAAELRAELSTVGRAGQAVSGYAALDTVSRLDRLR